MNRPNILLVMTDQQRYDLRASCGYPLDTMPFLDAFAQNGAGFARAYTPSPTCMPARVSLLTGRYPSAHRVRTNHNAMDALYAQDLLDVLKAAGYRTALCGKNHSHRPAGAFDFSAPFGHLGNEGETNTTPEEIAFAAFLRDTNHLESHVPAPGGVAVQHPCRSVNDALRFIDETGGSAPFFAWVSFAEPHNPYQAPAPYFDMFPPQSLPPLHAGKEILPEKGARWPWLRGVWEKVLGEDIEMRILRARSNYLGMLRLIDDQFRRLIEGLEQRGLRENTLVIFLSDHGDFAGEYGLIRKGVDLPDLLTHIPLAVQGPGVIRQGTIENAYVSLVDILPTLCDMLGVPAPCGVQGKSLWPLLSGQPYPVREFEQAYSEIGFSGLYWTERDGLTLPQEGATDERFTRFDCLNTWTQCGQVRMVCKDGWKLQQDMMGAVLLYNLTDDPYEVHNRADDPACAGVKAELLRALVVSMLRAEDPLPLPHHRYRLKTHPRGYWTQEGFAVDDPGVSASGPLAQYNHPLGR